MREVAERGNRWLVLDVKGIANDTLLSSSGNTTEIISERQEREITEVIQAGLQEEGIAAELRSIIPPAPPGVMRLIIPTLRLYLPLKDTSRDFYAAVVGAAFAHAMGASPSAVGALLAPQTVAILARRMKGLNDRDLQLVTAVSALNRQLDGPATNVRLSSNLGREVEADALRLSEQGVLRYVDGGWVVDF